MGQAGPVRDLRRVAVWRDGAPLAVPADEPVLTAFDQGLGRGRRVFESVAVLGGDTPHLKPHLARMAGSAALLQLSGRGPAVWSALVEPVMGDWLAKRE